MYTAVCNNSVAWGIDNLLCYFHITITFGYDICNSTDILCIIIIIIILYYIILYYIILYYIILYYIMLK